MFIRLFHLLVQCRFCSEDVIDVIYLYFHYTQGAIAVLEVDNEIVVERSNTATLARFWESEQYKKPGIITLCFLSFSRKYDFFHD